MELTRRHFLALNGALLANGTISLLPKYAWAQSSMRVRSNVNSLNSKHSVIETFREAVTKMHELPATDERSWEGQAYIHLDHCHRQPNHFLPWHRLYIWAFEEIVRELTGMKDWALPYWDWTNARSIPDVFFGDSEPLDTRTWDDADPQAAPLLDRNMGPTDTISEFTVDTSDVVNQGTYAVFSSRLDRGPHGGVHVAVGGHMGWFLSPLDPLFWVHHCNVDRIWARWNQSHANPSQESWLNEGFDDMFADRSGKLITGTKTAELLDISALGYTYDDLPEKTSDDVLASVPVDAESLGALFDEEGASASNEVPSILNIPTDIMVAATPKLTQQAHAANMAKVQSDEERTQFLARLSEIHIPANADNYVIRVFLNCAYLSPEVTPKDPHFVAEINLFGLRKMAKMNLPDMSVLVDLTGTMIKLRGEGRPVSDRFNVQLLPVAIAGRKVIGKEFVFGRVDIVSISYSRSAPAVSK